MKSDNVVRWMAPLYYYRQMQLALPAGCT